MVDGCYLHPMRMTSRGCECVGRIHVSALNHLSLSHCHKQHLQSLSLTGLWCLCVCLFLYVYQWAQVQACHSTYVEITGQPPVFSCVSLLAPAACARLVGPCFLGILLSVRHWSIGAPALQIQSCPSSHVQLNADCRGPNTGLLLAQTAPSLLSHLPSTYEN